MLYDNSAGEFELDELDRIQDQNGDSLLQLKLAVNIPRDYCLWDLQTVLEPQIKIDLTMVLMVVQGVELGNKDLK
jgi:hypothetical protein